jgi:hypothetical protein
MNVVSMKKASLAVALVGSLALLAGCGGSEGVFEAQGKVSAASGKALPDSADLSVLWNVSSGSPDYLYSYGGGSATTDGFDVSFDADPPAEALNSYGVGVGIVVAMPSGQGVAAGKVSDATMDTLDKTAVGATGQHAIIFKKAGATEPAWISAFPDGYSCAKGVPATNDGFDTYAPADCAEVVLTVDELDNIDFTNWT